MTQIVIYDAEGFIIATKAVPLASLERIQTLVVEAMEAPLVKEVRIRKGKS